jgi:hypothetical protein
VADVSWGFSIQSLRINHLANSAQIIEIGAIRAARMI